MNERDTAAYALLHRDATEVLTAWTPPNPAQQSLRDAYLAYLTQGPAVLAKAGPPAHLTASCLVLDASLTRVLLTHHRKADRWFQFGGHLEAGDAGVRAAARREAEEESGLAGLSLTAAPVHLDRHDLVGAFGHCRQHWDVRYAAIAPAGAQVAVSAESHDVRWFDLDALPEQEGIDLGPLIAAAVTALRGLG